MSAPLVLTGASRPRLADHVKMRFDEVRQRWVIMAPERMLVPDEIAVEIIQACDGKTALDQVVAALALSYDAPIEMVAPDVFALLQDLCEKGFVAA
jgi:pyrroloquinoline quinone biosynthesis protein D